jgi:hypothetical protein
MKWLLMLQDVMDGKKTYVFGALAAVAGGYQIYVDWPKPSTDAVLALLGGVGAVYGRLRANKPGPLAREEG